MSRKLLLVLSMLAALFLPTLVFAQEVISDKVTVSGTTVDFGSLLESILTLLASAATFMLIWLFRQGAAFFKSKTGINVLEQEGVLRKYLEGAMQNALKFGVEKLRDSEIGHVNTKSEAIAEAVAYVLNAVPDALSYFGITEQGLRDRLEARFGEVLADAKSVDAKATLQEADAKAAATSVAKTVVRKTPAK